MGFWLQIQADYGKVMLDNKHPEGKPSGGTAVFAFLGGLLTVRGWKEGDEEEFPVLKAVVDWYRVLEQSTGTVFFPTCQALLDCMWGNGGDPKEYREDEYELFLQDHSGIGDDFSEASFQEMVHQSKIRWKPIGDVARGVRVLLNVFERANVEPLDGFYVPEDTIPDFEALDANLDTLIKQGRKLVRLNFF